MDQKSLDVCLEINSPSLISSKIAPFWNNPYPKSKQIPSFFSDQVFYKFSNLSTPILDKPNSRLTSLRWGWSWINFLCIYVSVYASYPLWPISSLPFEMYLPHQLSIRWKPSFHENCFTWAMIKYKLLTVTSYFLYNLQSFQCKEVG